MKTIVCFGDSNTWGYDPGTGRRYPEDIRWTGRLQLLLGSGYKIIEEGQNGRTIAHSDPAEWGTRSGMDYVLPMLESHMPADMLAIMLGSNDLKAKFGLSAADIAGELRTMLMNIRGYCKYNLSCPELKILIIAPPAIGENISRSPFSAYFNSDTVVETSGQLARWYKMTARMFGCEFFDASATVAPGEADSLHLTAEGHGILAEALCEKIRNIFE